MEVEFDTVLVVGVEIGNEHYGFLWMLKGGRINRLWLVVKSTSMTFSILFFT